MSLNTLIPADEALKIVLGAATQTATVEVPLSNAANLVLAQDLVALRTQPPFDASSMDGYAVINSDLSNIPTKLKLIGESRAGVPFDKPLTKGKAVRIFTGAVIPEGADTIIIQENTKAGNGEVEILQSNEAGRFIRRAGLDFKEGDTLLKAGQILTPNRLALAASMNHAAPIVFASPNLAVFATGDELVLPGDQLKDGQIIASNTFGIQAKARSAGATVLDMGIVADTRSALKMSFEDAMKQGADVLVTTGGASVGDHDLVMPVAKELGFEFKIAKIAMRPGKPFLFATKEYENRTVYLTGLAGNPVSSLIAFDVFVRPLIQKLSGKPQSSIDPIPAILGVDLGANDERMEYMRAELKLNEAGIKVVSPFSKQDSSMLGNLVRADCLLKRPANAKASPKGEACEIILID